MMDAQQSERSIHMEAVDQSKYPDIHKVLTEQVLVKDETGAVVLEGKIKYASLLYQARLKKYKETMDGINTAEGQANIDDEINLSSRYHQVLKDRVIDVDVKSGEEKLTSIDDLYDFAEGIAVGNSLALKIITGQRLGKMKLE
jgi:hypothetical protein